MARGISVVISGSAAPLRKAIREATDSLGRMSTGATLAFGAAATATTLFAKQAIQAAADDQKQQALLARQLQVSAGATRAQVAAVEDYIDVTQRSVAVSDTELRAAYQSLAVATKDLALSQELANVSVDTAAATGRSASAVAEALARGYAGNTRALATLSPEVKKAIKDGATFSDVLDILRRNFAGAGAEASQTMAGQLAILGNTVDEAKESIGAALLPALQAIIPYFVNLANFAGRNAALLGGLATALGVLTTGVLAARGALAAWNTIATATRLANLALGLSFSAVQIATGVGIVTALAAIPVYLKMKDTFDDLKGSTNSYNVALGAVITSQKQLNDYMGPVPSRDLATFQKHYSGIADVAPKAAAGVDKAAKAFQTMKDRLTSAKQALRQYVDGIRDTIAGSVNLSSALSDADSQQADATRALTDALEDRRKAYEELNQARQTNDVNAYNQALGRVAAAETAVSDAQAKKPKSYGEIFREQVTAAKEFSGNLKKLIAAGLGKAGLAQILELGPVAGNAVAKDLLAGTGGLTVQGLEADLASVMAEAGTVGLALPGVAAALGATATRGTNNTYQITVQAGVGDKVEIGKQVVAVLQAYEKRLGGVPIKVQ
jgi:hypothetical protein